jgi:hypothetical protein
MLWPADLDHSGHGAASHQAAADGLVLGRASDVDAFHWNVGVGKMAAHLVLPWIHRVSALMKRWRLGTYHGLRRKHVDTSLNEFVFRYNRRFYRHVSFETMLGLAAHHEPASYWDVIGRANPRNGNVALRRVPRRRKTATGMRQDGSANAQIEGQNQASNAGA